MLGWISSHFRGLHGVGETGIPEGLADVSTEVKDDMQ